MQIIEKNSAYCGELKKKRKKSLLFYKLYQKQTPQKDYYVFDKGRKYGRIY